MSDGKTSAAGKRRKLSLQHRLMQSDAVLSVAASGIAAMLRLVHATSTTTFTPRQPEAVFADFAPMIITAWHGQAFNLPFLKPQQYPADVLASRNTDGELIARTLVKLGSGVVRGSGAADASRMHEKGAVAGFRAMKKSLDEGRSVVLTADFMKDARRKVGPGIIALARMSGRPILPVAFVSSRRYEVGSSWDRTTLSLPFGRAYCVFEEPVFVPRDADPAVVENKRAGLETSLNRLTDQAIALADRRHG